MTFGPNGFFGYTISSSAPGNSSTGTPAAYGPTAMWWSSYECAEVPDKTAFDPKEIKKQLLTRHAKWKDPAIHEIISNAKVDLATQSWTVAKLPEWQKNGLILVGDAAHGM
jgi:2-polyprenyl-6-methoxyphenol hydroxylase-like FAD-dependent oxidoreductase